MAPSFDFSIYFKCLGGITKQRSAASRDIFSAEAVGGSDN
jgi:hypothetical protein